MNPCLNMKFDELEDGHACYNPYARQNGFSIRQNHSRLSKEGKSLIGGIICLYKGRILS